MRRETLKWLAENSFIEHKYDQRKIRVHLKGLNGKHEEYTHWKDFHYGWQDSIWMIVMSDLKGYEVVIVEWLVNVYEKDMARKMAQYK